MDMSQIEFPWEDNLPFLVMKSFEGSLTEKELEELRSRLNSDESARLFFARSAVLQSQLETHFAIPLDVDVYSMTTNSSQTKKRSFYSLLFKKNVSLLSLCALLWCGAILLTYFLFFSSSPPHQIANKNPADSMMKKDDQPLNNSQQILKEGTIELTLPTGVNVLITAPATFQITGKNEITLTHGMLLAEVLTEEGKGFTVKTPSSINVDLGTVFGVAVDQKGTSVTQVFRGIVNSTNNLSKENSSPSSSPPQTIQLTTNQRILHRTDGTSKQGIKNLAELFFVNFDHSDSSSKNKNRVVELIGIDKVTAKKIREEKKEQTSIQSGLEDLEKRSMLPPYKVGHIWDREADWNNGTKEKTTLGNPDDDSLGMPVWRYEYSEEGGGRLSNDPWYKKETQLLQWDEHWYSQKKGGWVMEEDNQSAVLISVDSFLDYQNSEINCNMLVRWINPTGKSVRLKLLGTVLATWRKKAISPIDLIIFKEKNDGAYEEIWSLDALPIGNGKQTVDFDSLQKTFWIKPEESLLFTVRTTGKKDWIRVVDSFQLELVEIKK